MKKHLLITLSIVLIGLFSCTEDDNDLINCTHVFVPGLSVTLKEADTNNTITENVTITATDGSYEENLMTIEDSNTFFGAGERAGTYILTVTSTNYKTYTSEPITVLADQCHVITEDIEITLQIN